MTTALLTNSACQGHVTPSGHPERVDRLHAVLAALQGEQFGGLSRLEAPEVEVAALERVHSKSHIDHIERAAREAGGQTSSA